MPSNASGWFIQTLARETGKLGHLYSPGGQRGPWPWLPHAFDNGAFSCWSMETGKFHDDKWEAMLPRWRALMSWGRTARHYPLWAIVPDVPGDAERTLARWHEYEKLVPFRKAMAVQDGMEPSDVLALRVRPDVIAVGGSTEWKWGSLQKWLSAFKRVHVLRCNSPSKLDEMEEAGVESCDGTGWMRRDIEQTRGLERWARRNPSPYTAETWQYACNQGRNNTNEGSDFEDV